ncbi:MAG: Bax inhibitor-1/YccA family protein [Propionibacteriaceae bacterium]|nr:Bax inhibitor-1/YccA family protein [Propionibacteriaceae bacterium]
MANPVLSKPGAFTQSSEYQGGYPGYQYNPYTQQMPGYAHTQQMPGYAPQPVARGGVMTLDDVIAKTSIVMVLLVASAAATWLLLPWSLQFPVLIVSALACLVTVFFVASRREIPIGGVVFYALLEGVFIGVFSRVFEVFYPGIVGQAVMATFVAAGVTLLAYKFFNIRVTSKFRKIVSIGVGALLVLMLVNFGFALFNVDLGLRSVGSGAGWLSILISVVAVGLAVASLIVDFDSIEQGIAQRVPAKESWRAAFGITVTMVWLYTELLRILSYFRD